MSVSNFVIYNGTAQGGLTPIIFCPFLLNNDALSLENLKNTSTEAMALIFVLVVRRINSVHELT
jgi:hypothetical protein